ncbi:MAG: alanine--tRNA ligase [Actinomycetia bacterium]|nr:alanine--tRNA ligase [Actinomycetes bacterium]
MRTAAELREGFLSFFEEKDHLRRPSGSLVPATYDPSVLLTTAGMQPLKPYFLGLESPPAPRLVTVQKCFRTTDIDFVGLTGRHLTFFEMLGNFSLGDYFKDGAVDLAWEFVAERLSLPRERLWATVFAGDSELRLGQDEVAVAAWQRVGIPGERIRGLPRSDNFWQAGPTGPCGPCSELYFDRGAEHGCARPDCAPGCDCDRYLEFWNLVFMEFNLHDDGTLTPLPEQNIDTGLGVERGSALMQDVDSVYETDGFRSIIDWVTEETGTLWGESESATKAHRVLADHGRAMTFLVGDGVVPANEGRGYVLRRVIRRAIQHGSRLGLEPPFVAALSDIVIDLMSPVYGDLAANRTEIHDVLGAEEERFSQTLKTGLRLFDEVLERSSNRIAGDDAFRLHDTYGFPLELTRELADERGLAVDEDGFEQLMAEQRERSRAGRGSEVEQAAQFARSASFNTEFVGYEKLDVLTQLGACEATGNGCFLGKLRESPFYPEGGGQVSDAGWIEHEEGSRAEVVQAYRLGDDQALLLRGDGFAEGDRIRAVVNWGKRFPTEANHTATHLLHGALREVLGDHVRQAGSSVQPDKLRFDFSHGQALTPAERERVESLVNERIFANSPVRAYTVSLEEAKRLGTTMLFGEKYGEHVRVLEVGGVSRELCGGTHVRSSAEIGAFKILAESSTGATTRRIEAVTSRAAGSYLFEQEREVRHLSQLLEDERKARAKLAREAQRSGSRADDLAEELLDAAREVDGITVLIAQTGRMEADALLQLSDTLKQRREPATVVLGAPSNGRLNLVANFSQSAVDRGASAADAIRTACAIVGGGGGGRPTMARGAGTDLDRLDEALKAVEQAVVEALG